MKMVVTGANGQLGRLTIAALLSRLPASAIIAAVRSPDQAQDLATRGIEIRHADYDLPESLETAFTDADRLLLISSNAMGRRVPQHQAVIAAAKRARIGLVAYTSILHADDTPLAAAEEHRPTEAALRASGVPFVLLRNGWYSENFLRRLPAALPSGELLGCAGNGRISAATRLDYAEAAAAVLAGGDHAGKAYELAGDTAFTLASFADAAADRFGQHLLYRDLSESDFVAELTRMGFPAFVAEMIARSDTATRNGALFDETCQLSALIGRPTTKISEALGAMPDPEDSKPV